jgi:hypothetical protein
MLAARNCDVDSVRDLLDHRSEIPLNLNVADAEGRTALILAATYYGQENEIYSLLHSAMAESIKPQNMPLEMKEKVEQLYAEGSTRQCPICYNDLQLQDAVAPDCGSYAHLHVHHLECFKRWIEESWKNNLPPKCPFCQGPAHTLLRMPGESEIVAYENPE